MSNEFKCPTCGKMIPVDATLIKVRQHMLDDHRTPYTMQMAAAMVAKASAMSATAPMTPLASAAAPLAPTVPAAKVAPVVAPSVAPGTLPLAGKVVAVAGFFNHTYTAERVDQILIAAGAKTTDRRGLNRASLLLAGGRIGDAKDRAEQIGLEVKDLAWLMSIEAEVAALAQAGPAPVDPGPVAAGPVVAPEPVVVPVVAPRPVYPVPASFRSLVIPFVPNPHIPEPTGKYEWMGLDRFLGMMVEDNEKVLLVGPAGCGKSQGVIEMAGLTNHPLIRVNLDGQATTQDLIGKPGASAGTTYWIDGALVTAMRKGYWFLADEIDMAEPDVLAVLHAITEEGGYLVIKENGGEVVKPHPDFRFFGNGNSLGLHDDSGIYAGTKAMNAALLDRCVVRMLDHASEAKEARILAGRGIPLEVAKLVVSAGTAIRKLISDGILAGAWTTRKAIAFAKYAVRTGSYEEAFEIAARGKFSEAEFKAAWETASRITGKTLKNAAASPAA